ncbi:GNAT family N-acetyltransferase [bacterium]|nr:GNAT family N-acetyltransferase [bacterium]
MTLRPATPDDRSFLERVYAESRAAELEATGWPDDEKDAFCRGQFAAQDSHYRTYYPDCEYLVVERDGEPVGRLYRERRADEIRIVDIALLADARGHGLGGRLMRRILDEAAAADLMVRIHVERTNPARRLYDRLGFELVEEGDVYDLLAWSAAPR